MAFDQTTTSHEWMTFLLNVKEIASSSNHQVNICPMIVMFRSAESKRLYVQATKKDAKTAIETGESTAAEEDIMIENYSQGLTIGRFLSLIRSSGTLAIFTNAVGNAVQQQAEKVLYWHTYAVFYRNGILAVYDPNFIRGTETFHSCTGVPLVKQLVEALRGKRTNRKVTEIWFGGGGNRSTRCQEMTRKWVEWEIGVKDGANLGNWEKRKGWVKLYF